MPAPARSLAFPRILGLSLLCLALQGCCGLYELWGCGPRQSLVPVSFDSPKRALNSFRAAIRFQDSNVLYECLSEEFKEQHGFDAFGFAVFWEKLIEREPAIPALGDARIVEARWLSPVEREFVLETYGRRVRVSFSSRPSYEYGELRAFEEWPPKDGPSTEDATDAQAEAEPEDELVLVSAYLDSLADAGLVVRGEHGQVAASVRSEDLLEIDIASFGFLRVGRTWKLRRLAIPGGSD